MEEPYFDDDLHMFAIDVYLNGFRDQYAWAIELEIEYTNLNLIIDEAATEASQYSGLAGIGAEDFELSPGFIGVKGNCSCSFSESPQFTGTDEQFLFTIYFTGTARLCSDFTFEFKGIGVAFPNIPTVIPCEGGEGNDCEPEDVCLVGWTLGGIIEKATGQCNGAYNGGIPNVDVYITESYDVNIFGCETNTDSYGEYECDVVEHLDYRVTPINDYDDNCGVTELDLLILRKHILGQESLIHLWQWYAGDMNSSGTLSTADLLEILKAYEEEPVDWLSWHFIPTSTYGSTVTPDDFELNVPSYNPFIDVEDVDEDISNLNFIGVKMGDLNASCEDCSSFTGEEEVFTRSAPIDVNLVKEKENNFALSFNNDVRGMEIFTLAIQCSQEPEITYIPFENTECFLTWYDQGIYFIAYVSLKPEGDSFLKGEPILKLRGSLDHTSQGGNQKQNTVIYENNHSTLKLVHHRFPSNEIYPNPASTSIYVELAELNGMDASIFIYDMVGNFILSRPLTANTMQIDLDLTTGPYLYKIKNGELITNGKLIIQ